MSLLLSIPLPTTNQPINQPTNHPTNLSTNSCFQPLPPNPHREGFTPPYNPSPAARNEVVCGRRRSRFWSRGGFGPDLFLVPFLVHFLFHFWAAFAHPNSAPDPLRRAPNLDPFLEPLWEPPGQFFVNFCLPQTDPISTQIGVWSGSRGQERSNAETVTKPLVSASAGRFRATLFGSKTGAQDRPKRSRKRDPIQTDLFPILQQNGTPIWDPLLRKNRSGKEFKKFAGPLAQGV